ncbi:MAG: hydrogenase maturation protease [Candidatus Nitrospinota bacterium M3_3B_026]
MNGKVLIGVGSEDRGDDAAGLRIVRALRDMVPRSVEVVEAPGEGARIMEAWQGFHFTRVFDAVSSGAPPGTIVKLDPRKDPFPAAFFRSSSHTFGLAEAVELARSLGALPPSLMIYGVEGKDYGLGRGLSAEVSAAVDEIVEMVKKEMLSSPSMGDDG